MKKQNKTDNRDGVVLHGEAMIISRKSLPSNLKRKDMSGEPYYKIADSETTGNHHVLELHSGVEIFEGENGKVYASASEPFNVKCVHQDRHSTATFPAGNYEFGPQQEFDPFQARLKNVAD
jgi:hypothetical protein